MLRGPRGAHYSLDHGVRVALQGDCHLQYALIRFRCQGFFDMREQTQFSATIPVSGKALRILIIEDAEDDALLLLHRFRRAGYAVHYARVDNPQAMREALQAGTWDLVLSDHRMPSFSAMAALSLLQAHGLDLPFIIVSGQIDEDTAVATMRAGAHDYLLKDHLDRLLPAVERELREAQIRSEHRAALEAVRESEARFRALAANVPGMVFQLAYASRHFAIHFASDGCYPLLGLQPEQVVTQPELFLRMIEAADRERLMTAFQRSLERASDVNWDGRIRFEDGEIKWINMRASPRAENGSKTVWEGIMSNITHSKNAEADLRASRQQLRELQLHLERVKEEERERIARDIHDILGGTLVAIKIETSLLESRLASEPGTLGPRIRSIEKLIDEAIATSGRVARELRPGILKEFGLAAAIECQAEDFSQRTGVACRCDAMDYDVEVSEDASIALFRVFQEALTNIAKHAGATRVDVTLEQANGKAILAICDNGRGIAAGDLNKPRSYGLRGMRERLVSLGGSFSINAQAGGGTAVTLQAPLVDQSDATPATGQ